eukprot:scaffold18964_cov33-Phaeocystis_antarctica.AAC.1
MEADGGERLEHLPGLAWKVKGGEIDDLGGGWLEHPRQWLGRSLPRERRASQSCQARPEEAQELSWGAAKGAL